MTNPPTDTPLKPCPSKSVLEDNAPAFHAAQRYMQTATPFRPAHKATAEKVLALLRGWSDSEFATAASGEFGEDLKACLEGALSRALDTIEARRPIEDELVEAVRGMIPTNLCLSNKHIPDSLIVPLETTMGGLRKLAETLSRTRIEEGS